MINGCTFGNFYEIEIEPVVSQLFIHLIENTNIKKVSLWSIQNFGECVVKNVFARSKSMTIVDDAVFHYSDLYLENFLREHKDLFVKKGDFIELKNETDIETLRKSITKLEKPLLLTLLNTEIGSFLVHEVILNL